jgi:hypothetical protein
MEQVSACGWLLSVLRAPTGTGIYSPPHNTHSTNTGSFGSQNGDSSNAGYGGMKSANVYTLLTSCKTLSNNGLDDSLGELLLVVHQASVDEVVSHLGILQFAAKVRATAQLKRLYSVWAHLHYSDASIGLLTGTEPPKRGNEDVLLSVPDLEGMIDRNIGEGGYEGNRDKMCANMIAAIERSCFGYAKEPISGKS